MHPLDRVRQVSSYLLAGLLCLNAVFAYAMTAVVTVRSVRNVPGFDWSTTLTFAGLTVVFVAVARFFAWFGRRAGR